MKAGKIDYKDEFKTVECEECHLTFLTKTDETKCLECS
jgi:hypothetical protein